jgi:hypothetical protein
MKITNTFRDAQFLAEFANLDAANAERVQDFRHNHPDFAPDSWWDYPPKSTIKLWLRNQEWLREAWDQEFIFDGGLFVLMRLTTSVFDPEPMLANAAMFKHSDFPYFAQLSDVAEEWGYHRAVRYVAEKPWRAKICKECGERYIADHGKRKYCTIALEDGKSKCSSEVIKRQHLKSAKEHNYWR